MESTAPKKPTTGGQDEMIVAYKATAVKAA